MEGEMEVEGRGRRRRREWRERWREKTGIEGGRRARGGVSGSWPPDCCGPLASARTDQPGYLLLHLGQSRMWEGLRGVMGLR